MELPKEYPMAVATALAINVQCWLTAWDIGSARKKYFNKQFMKKQFGEVHKKQLGQQILAGGYPDTGNGLYATKLSYKEWYNFNVLQRIHLNYIQNLSFVTTATLATGLYQPRTAAYIGLSFMFGRYFLFLSRLLYSFFYKKQGGAFNKGRLAGALICLASLLASTGVFFWNFYKNTWGK